MADALKVQMEVQYRDYILGMLKLHGVLILVIKKYEYTFPHNTFPTQTSICLMPNSHSFSIHLIFK